MKKNIFLIIFLASLLFIVSNYYNVFGVETSGTLTVDKQNYLVTDNRQCFTFTLPNENLPVQEFDVQLYTFGPNNQGCVNGCTVKATRYFIFSTMGQFCIDPAFSSNSAGNWSAYVVYNNKQTAPVNYTVQSNLNLSSISNTSNTGDTFNIFLDANGLENLSVAPGNSIQYNWRVESNKLSNLTSGNYSLVSWYTADKPDTCQGGISAVGQIKPWVISGNEFSGFKVADVNICQEGVKYTITLAVRDNNGNIIASKSINVSVSSKNQYGLYIPQDFCSKIENNKSYTYDELRQIFQPYYESDKKSCDLQLSKYMYNGYENLYNPSIPYSPDGDGKGIPPGTLYKADFYFSEVDSGGAIIRIKRGYKSLCSHFDNDLFSVLGFGPGAVCGIMPSLNLINYCVNSAPSAVVVNSIKEYCGKNISIKETTSSSNYTYPQTSTSTSLTPGLTTLTPSSSLNFNPLNLDYYRGPVQLSFENTNRQTTGLQNLSQTNQTSLNTVSSQTTSNYSLEVVKNLVSVLEKISGILNFYSSLSAENQSKLSQSIQLLISAIQDILNKLK